MRVIILADVHLALGPIEPGLPDVSYSQRLLSAAVEKSQGLEPDRVILLGDILNSGSPDEYALACRLLAPLQDRTEPLVGNHELLKGNLADWQAAWGVPPYRQTMLGALPAVFLSSGIEGLPVSQWGGRLDHQQLASLDAFLSANRRSPVLTFCHHAIRATVRRSDQPMMGLDNSADLARRLSAHPRRSVLFSGHNHYQSIAESNGIVCVGCPSLCFWPHAFLLADIAADRVQIRTVRLLDTPEQSPDPQAPDAAYRARAEGQECDQTATLMLD